jgi:hypothetical protein
MCPTCGNALGAVDSYGVTSFAPVLPAPQPVERVSVRNPQDLGVASTMMSSSVAVPPTMASNTPHGPQQQPPNVPRYVVTPARGASQPPMQPVEQMQPAPPTMQSAPVPPNYGMVPMPSAAPMTPGAYGPPQQPYSQQYGQPYAPMIPLGQEPTPPLAIASLICGLLGWIPLWIGFILCLLAIIFASIVLFNTRPGQSGRGLAITGLVFGLVLFIPAACGL